MSTSYEYQQLHESLPPISVKEVFINPHPPPQKKNPYTYFSEQMWLAANTYINYLKNMRRIGNECMLGCVERKENTVLCIDQVLLLLCVCVCGKIPDMQPFFVKLDFKK